MLQTINAPHTNPSRTQPQGSQPSPNTPPSPRSKLSTPKILYKQIPFPRPHTHSKPHSKQSPHPPLLTLAPPRATHYILRPKARGQSPRHLPTHGPIPHPEPHIDARDPSIEPRAPSPSSHTAPHPNNSASIPPSKLTPHSQRFLRPTPTSKTQNQHKLQALHASCHNPSASQP